MPNNEGNKYYWDLHSKNATGENVGAVLDDLSDIEVTPEEELDDEHKAVIVEYDEDLGRNKFKLSKAINIPGIDNQVIVANGQGMIKANTSSFIFSDGTNSVTFSISDLIYLKRFIGTLPSRVIEDESEATIPETLYFLPEEEVNW